VFITASLLVGVTQGVDQSLPPAARTAVESFAGQAAAYGAALAALAVLLILRRGLRVADLGWRLPRPLGRAGWLPWLAIAVVSAVVALYLADLLGSLATHLLPSSPNTQCTAVRDEYGGYVSVAIPLVCLIAPLAEETIFRGFLYGWLRRRLTVLPAVVISAALFSAAHVVLVLALPLFGVGVILALLYEYSDSLIPGAIVHGLFNLVGIVAILGTTVSC
jgi:membrane protease YdiL (CAAX protease family)